MKRYIAIILVAAVLIVTIVLHFQNVPSKFERCRAAIKDMYSRNCKIMQAGKDVAALKKSSDLARDYAQYLVDVRYSGGLSIPDYLHKGILRDPWSREFCFDWRENIEKQFPSSNLLLTNAEFIIWSAGPDGKNEHGGGDDIYLTRYPAFLPPSINYDDPNFHMEIFIRGNQSFFDDKPVDQSALVNQLGDAVKKYGYPPIVFSASPGTNVYELLKLMFATENVGFFQFYLQSDKGELFFIDHPCACRSPEGFQLIVLDDGKFFINGKTLDIKELPGELKSLYKKDYALFLPLSFPVPSGYTYGEFIELARVVKKSGFYLRFAYMDFDQKLPFSSKFLFPLKSDTEERKDLVCLDHDDDIGFVVKNPYFYGSDIAYKDHLVHLRYSEFPGVEFRKADRPAEGLAGEYGLFLNGRKLVEVGIDKVHSAGDMEVPFPCRYKQLILTRDNIFCFYFTEYGYIGAGEVLSSKYRAKIIILKHNISQKYFFDFVSSLYLDGASENMDAVKNRYIAKDPLMLLERGMSRKEVRELLKKDFIHEDDDGLVFIESSRAGDGSASSKQTTLYFDSNTLCGID